MEALGSVLEAGPMEGGHWWATVAFVMLQVLLVATSMQPEPHWWHWGVSAWRWCPRAAGVGLGAAVAALEYGVAACRSLALPRAGTGTLQAVAGGSMFVAAAWLLNMASPGAAIYVLLLGAVPVLAAVFSGRGEVTSPAWHGLLWGTVLGALLLWGAHGEYHAQHGAWGSWIPEAFAWGLGLPLAWLGWRAIENVEFEREARGLARRSTAPSADPTKVERDPKAFDRLVGVGEAVEAIKDAVELPLLHAEKVRRYGVAPAKGILLVGPPGTGKTALARAAAAYCGCAFRAVSQADMVRNFVGSSEAAVKELFTWARQNAPAILFIDEIDAIGGRRDGQSLNRASDIILRCLLAEMDGFEPLKGVLVIAATNAAHLLDPALRRPGRFDREIEIGLPDAAGRRAIWDVYLRERPLGGDVDTAELAAMTEGWSPAAIAGAANQAALLALKRGLAIGQADLMQVLAGARRV